MSECRCSRATSGHLFPQIHQRERDPAAKSSNPKVRLIVVLLDAHVAPLQERTRQTPDGRA